MAERRLQAGCASARLVCFLLWLMAVSVAAQEPEGEEAQSGLDANVPVFEVDNRPIKEVLNLLARFSDLNFITTGQVQDVPITAKMSNATVRQILDTVLPNNGLAYLKKTGEDFITVMTQAEYDEIVKKKPEMHTKIFDIRWADMQDVAPVVTQLKSPDGTLFIIPHLRRIIATDYLDRLDEMARIIREMDTQTIRRAFPLKYINAQEALEQLRQVISPNAAVQVDPVNNIIIIEDIPQNIAEVETILAELDRQRPLMVFEMQYIDPGEVLDMIQSLNILTEQAQIDYHEATNKIILQDIPSRVKLAQQVIEALDAPPLQIHIEASIMDANLDRLLEIGPDYEWGGEKPIGSATSALGIDFTDTFVRFLSGRLRVTDITDLFGRDFRLAVDLLESDGVLRTVSTPFGRVRNHSELYFQDGAEEPFLVRQRRIGSTTISTDEIFTQRTRSVGRIISVLPHANSSGYIYMLVSVEDSDAENVVIEGQTLLRVIEKTVETEVDVKSGHTVALGGLIFEKEDRDVSGIPYLKDIPLLGMAFRHETTRRTRRKLVIFITPYVENLEDPFAAYEAYVAPGAEEISEYQGLEFKWGDEEGPPLGIETEGVYELDSMEDLPEEYRTSIEGMEEPSEVGVEWISPEPEDEAEPETAPEKVEQPAGDEKTGSASQPGSVDAGEPDPLDKLVPVF